MRAGGMQAGGMRARAAQARGPIPRDALPGDGRLAPEPVRTYGLVRPGPVARLGTRAERARWRTRVAALRSAIGLALLPCAFAATLVWLVFLGWLVVKLVDLPFR
jgi:hypothetical protein